MSSSIITDHSGNEESQKWFIEKDWLRGWRVRPDVSIDEGRFQEAYRSRQILWEKAFNFLATEDLGKIRVGDVRLDGNDLFVLVQEYFTKDEQETRYEAHRKYADIQYVFSGSEQIGITSLANTKVIVPYDGASDVVFLSAPAHQYHPADNRSFFIFLPDDAHRPCVKNDVSAFVRKIVVKVRIA